MNNVKVIEVTKKGITFSNGTKLYSEHEQDCCESHELCFADLTLIDFEDLEFNLSNDNFFKRVPDYGIELVPISGHSVKVPGYGYNNGYYGNNIDLVLESKEERRVFGISECQVNHYD